MSFKRLSALGPEYCLIANAIERAERVLAAALPHKRVYSQREIDAFDYGSLDRKRKVADALIEMGILTVERKWIHPESGFRLDDGFHEDVSEFEEYVRYNVTGQLMSLIDDFKNKPDSLPYFISYTGAESANYATDLDVALESDGLEGFLSSDLEIGDEWKLKIIAGLRKARTAFLFESPEYHRRERCVIERDFLIAKGCRILRVGVGDHSRLHDLPSWIDDNIQYEVKTHGSGFDLSQVLEKSLPDRLSLNVRRRGGINLLSKISPSAVSLLATNLSLEDELNGAAADRRIDLVNIVFRSEVRANAFCQEFPLLDIF